jgi:hypothetical protein
MFPQGGAAFLVLTVGGFGVNTSDRLHGGGSDGSRLILAPVALVPHQPAFPRMAMTEIIAVPRT